MTSALSNLVNNLAEGIHRIRRKYGHDDKNVDINIDINIVISSLNKQTLRVI